MAGSLRRYRPFALALIACGILAAGGAIGYAVASSSSPPTAKRTALARTLKPRGAPVEPLASRAS